VPVFAWAISLAARPIYDTSRLCGLNRPGIVGGHLV
jgi:hypothetical protein